MNLQSCENKYNLENTFWKHCGDYPISEVIVIGKECAVYVRNDSIYFNKNDLLFGVIDTIEYYYGERRLLLRDLKGKDIVKNECIENKKLFLFLIFCNWQKQKLRTKWK